MSPFLLQCPSGAIYWQSLNIVPAGKGEIFAEFIKAMKNLEPRGSKVITGMPAL